MISLVDGLPEDSRVHSGPSDGWNRYLEMLALIVEEIGLLAADRRREEPFTVARPERSDTVTRRSHSYTPRPQAPAPEPPEPRMSGHKQMLMAAMQRGMIRSG
ncbi:hypothetical protein ABZ023_18085 [Streptomyces sp. NPDC006367]|uniref:hypothetical protein n=1 Tax=unclassified Streptomyces TaxID=2593676 RepID=UPI0033A28922